MLFSRRLLLLQTCAEKAFLLHGNYSLLQHKSADAYASSRRGEGDLCKSGNNLITLLLMLQS